MSIVDTARTPPARARRILSSPLDVLRSRKSLDPDASLNDQLYEAGERYRYHWMRATGAASLSGQRLTGMPRHRPGASAGSAAEAALWHSEQLRRARTVLGPYLARWLEAVVIVEKTPLEAGRHLSGYADRTSATAIAMESLRAALATLAGHWRLIEGKPRSLDSTTPEAAS